ALREHRSVPEPLMLATLVPLDATSALVVVAGTPAKTYRATVGVGKVRGVTLEQLDTEIPLMFPVVFKPADGPPLAWPDPTRGRLVPLDWLGTPETKWYEDAGYDLFEFRAGKWEKRKDLSQPAAVSDDGTLWCWPTESVAGEPRGTRLTLCRL